MKLARLDPLASAPEIDREPELVVKRVLVENMQLHPPFKSATQNRTQAGQESPSKEDMLGAFTRLSDHIKAKLKSKNKKSEVKKGSIKYKAFKAYSELDDLEVRLMQKGSSFSRRK